MVSITIVETKFFVKKDFLEMRPMDITGSGPVMNDSTQVLHHADSVSKTEMTKVINNSSLVTLPQKKDEKISVQHANNFL